MQVFKSHSDILMHYSGKKNNFIISAQLIPYPYIHMLRELEMQALKKCGGFGPGAHVIVFRAGSIL